jgi:Na+-transporting methylmalonyl-CoA/oxaloacetate decarboxylase gamma subunit
MSLAVVLQVAGLAVVVVIGIILVYVILEMREVYGEQRDKFLRAITAVEDFKPLVERIQKENRTLVEIGHHMEKAAEGLRVASVSTQGQSAAAMEEFRRHISAQEAELRDVLGAAFERITDSSRTGMIASAERHAASIEELRAHLDTQEMRMQEILQFLKEIADSARTPQKEPAPAPASLSTASTAATADFSHLRKNALVDDPQQRFVLLKQWVSANAMAILRRSHSTWLTPMDLIAGIPDSFEAEVELLDDRILVIGTRDVTDRVALPIKQLDPASDFAAWFDLASNGTTAHAEVPAILHGSNGNLTVASKGIAWSAQQA